FTVTDDSGNSITAQSEGVTQTINVTPVNDAPVVTAGGTALAYTENGAAAFIDSNLTVSDADSINLTRATIQITGNFKTGDTLAFATQNGISASGAFNTTTHTLILTGTTSVTNYQT